MSGIDREFWTWRMGKFILKKMAGVEEKEAGALIGRWIKKCGNDHLRFREIIETAAEKDPGDFVTYVHGCMPKNGNSNGVEIQKSILQMRVNSALKGMVSQHELQPHEWQAAINFGMVTKEQARQRCDRLR